MTKSDINIYIYMYVLKMRPLRGVSKRIFQSQIVAMQKEDSDAGESVTEQEFINAVLYAVQELFWALGSGRRLGT